MNEVCIDAPFVFLGSAILLIDPTPRNAYPRGMTIELTHEQEQLLEQVLATGHFSDKGEVIAEALALLKRQGEARAQLQTDIQKGLDDLAAGRYRTLTPETASVFAAETKQRGRELKAKREQTAS